MSKKRFSLLDICVHFGETVQSVFISLNQVFFSSLLIQAMVLIQINAHEKSVAQVISLENFRH